MFRWRAFSISGTGGPCKGESVADEPRTYSQEEVDQLFAEREAGLKANRDEALKEAKAAKARLAAYDGVDPEKYKQLVQAAEDADRKKAAAEGDFKALEKQLVDKYEGEIQKREGTIKQYRGALESYLIDAEASRELAQHSDSPGLLLPHIRSRMQVIEQDGQFVTRIVDPATGQVRIGKGQGSSPMTLTELVEEMKTDKTFALAFRGTGSSGGGASKSTASSGGKQVIASTHDPAFIQNLQEVASGKVEVATQ